MRGACELFFLILNCVAVSRVACRGQKVRRLRDSFAKEVTSLPGLNFPINFRHYSGYLRANTSRYLHFWFVECEASPEEAPLVLWMNGGPGCSSLDGFLSELGPFHINDDGKTLYANAFAWNKIANVIFLEAPAGVGFSYDPSSQPTWNDDKTSLDNYNALKEFFSLFPDYRENDFYITGESYGGIYVPTLAVRILDGLSTYPITFKGEDNVPFIIGIAVGNGMLSWHLNTNTLVQFMYEHGLVDEISWQNNERKCCSGCADTCDFSRATEACEDWVNTVVETIANTRLNVYDLYRDCQPSNGFDRRFRYYHDAKLAVPHLDELLDREPTIESPLTEDVPCLNDSLVINYLNMPSVRKALAIPEYVQRWDICNMTLNAAYDTTLYADMMSQVRSVIRAGLRVLVYNGDTDMACNFLMGQKFSEVVGKGSLLSNKRAWYYNHQVAGFVTRYNNLDFATVKGTGHMVPQWKPEQSLLMISTFLSNSEWPTNRSLEVHTLQ